MLCNGFDMAKPHKEYSESERRKESNIEKLIYHGVEWRNRVEMTRYEAM